MQRFIEIILAFLAKQILAKHKPLVIGVTGSVGKTSTRKAIFCVARERFSSYTPVKNLNTLLGLPLGVLMSGSPGRSVFGWIKVFLKGLYLWLFSRKYPQVLVLEYGIDHPGEMDQLLAIARPNIGVLTYIGTAHLENYKDQDELAREKSKLLSGILENGTAIVNRDSELAVEQTKRVYQERKDLKILDYSGYKHPEALVHADNIDQDFSAGTIYTEIFVKTPTRISRVSVSALGEPHVLATVASVAVAEALNIPSDDIAKGLAKYKPEPGRLNIIPGAKKSIIIDDTYNASPASTLMALDLLGSILKTNEEKIAVLGDMLELGSVSEAEHRRVGRKVAEMKIGFLICVGNLAKAIGQEAVLAGMEQTQVKFFATSEEAGKFLFPKLNEDIIVLVKGSQGIRMEKIVKEVMAEPMKAKELLCRQDERWLNK